MIYRGDEEGKARRITARSGADAQGLYLEKYCAVRSFNLALEGGRSPLKCVHFDIKNIHKGLPTVATAALQRAQSQKFLISNGMHIS